MRNREKTYHRMVTIGVPVIVLLLLVMIIMRFFGIGGSPQAEKPLPPGIDVRLAQVLEVKDPRNVKVRLEEDNSEIWVRLIGVSIDATPQSSRELVNRIGGKVCYLRYDQEILDEFDRHYVYMYDENRRMVNLWMIREGYAYLEPNPPNMGLYREMEAAQEEAWKAGRQLWKNCTYRRR